MRQPFRLDTAHDIPAAHGRYQKKIVELRCIHIEPADALCVIATEESEKTTTAADADCRADFAGGNRFDAHNLAAAYHDIGISAQNHDAFVADFKALRGIALAYENRRHTDYRNYEKSYECRRILFPKRVKQHDSRRHRKKQHQCRRNRPHRSVPLENYGIGTPHHRQNWTFTPAVKLAPYSR